MHTVYLSYQIWEKLLLNGMSKSGKGRGHYMNTLHEHTQLHTCIKHAFVLLCGTHMHMHIHTHTHSHVHAHPLAVCACCAHVCMPCACVHARVHVCMQTHLLNTHMHTNTYTYRTCTHKHTFYQKQTIFSMALVDNLHAGVKMQ